MPAQPRARLVLLQDYQRNSGQPDVSRLRDQLRKLPEFSGFELESQGGSTVVATVPARNQRDSDRLRSLVKTNVEGWRVVEDSQYALPKTF